ncbi:hypothetical protein YC2023_054617 [Brassica napus]
MVISLKPTILTTTYASSCSLSTVLNVASSLQQTQHILSIDRLIIHSPPPLPDPSLNPQSISFLLNSSSPLSLRLHSGDTLVASQHHDGNLKLDFPRDILSEISELINFLTEEKVRRDETEIEKRHSSGVSCFVSNKQSLRWVGSCFVSAREEKGEDDSVFSNHSSLINGDPRLSLSFFSAFALELCLRSQRKFDRLLSIPSQEADKLSTKLNGGEHESTISITVVGASVDLAKKKIFPSPVVYCKKVVETSKTIII